MRCNNQYHNSAVDLRCCKNIGHNGNHVYFQGINGIIIAHEWNETGGKWPQDICGVVSADYSGRHEAKETAMRWAESVLPKGTIYEIRAKRDKQDWGVAWVSYDKGEIGFEYCRPGQELFDNDIDDQIEMARYLLIGRYRV